jgi:hypothetical protein
LSGIKIVDAGLFVSQPPLGHTDPVRSVEPSADGPERPKEGRIMAGNQVVWRHSLEDARREAREQGKLVLVDLFNPG